VTKDLELYIKYELYKHRKFAIPGVGTFLLKRIPSQFSGDRTIIYPPTFQVEFTEDQDPNTQLSAEYTNELATISNTLSDELLAKGKSKIAGLGIFINEGDHVKYYPDKDLEGTYAMGLQPITDIKEVNRTYVSPPETIAKTKYEDKDAFTRWLPFLLSLLLTLGAMAWVYYKPDFFNFSAPIRTLPIIDTPKVVIDTAVKIDTIHNETLIDTLTADTSESKIDSIITSTQIDIKKETDSINKLLNEKKIVKPVPAVKKVIKPATPKATPMIKRPIELPPAPIKKTTPEIIQDEKQVQISSAAKGNQCMIITGSFTDQKNIDNMVDKLKKQGYKVFLLTIDNVTRVGIKYECEKADEAAILLKVKDTVAPGAWIMPKN
jgi:hypothetical protein